MNIQQATAQLEAAVRAYGARTPDGAYRVPLAAQRPLYLIGPPGVGKTAVVAQVARKLGIGYAAYTMTHHTRQSALGLPVIAHRTLNGREQAVTEYTMSEIVATVWTQAEAGAEQGILFLDEINCVSESLMPAMLQLLQYKTFGVHALPRGWVVVCAGNPPKYNRYAHTFDAVVMDRLRALYIEPDLNAWRAFAAEHGVHPSIRAYLALQEADFYASDGDSIVTARSWTDLSDVMLAMDAAADEALFAQYLQIDEIAERFWLFHRLCVKLQGQLDGVLRGERVSFADAPFDAALYAALLLSGRLQAMAAQYALERRRAARLENFAQGIAQEQGDVVKSCDEHLARLENALDARKRMGALSEQDEAEERHQLSRLREMAAEARIAATIAGEEGRSAALLALRASAKNAQRPVDAQARALETACARTLDFIENGIADPNVRLVFLNDLRTHGEIQDFVKKRFKARLDALWSMSDPDERAKRL